MIMLHPLAARVKKPVGMFGSGLLAFKPLSHRSSKQNGRFSLLMEENARTASTGLVYLCRVRLTLRRCPTVVGEIGDLRPRQDRRSLNT
jgi:hypothetical protein